MSILWRTLGFIEYFLRPGIRKRESGPFNGQHRRKELVLSIITELHPGMLYETGTCRGATASFLARANIPLNTVESNARFYGYSKARFIFKSNVRVHLGDSRIILMRLAKESAALNIRSLFYLDAHWNMDVPLAKELDIVLHAWRDPIVMIDDFRVPGSAHGYDAYNGIALDAAIVKKNSPPSARLFVPAYPASEEGGAQRGWAIVASNDATSVWLTASPYLRELPRDQW